MAYFRIIIVPTLLVSVVMLLAGCDSASTDPKLQTGDLDDPEFEQIDALFGEGFTDMSGSMLDLTFQLIDSIPVPAGIKKTTLSVSDGDFDNVEFDYSYNAQTYWHVFTVSASVTEDDGDGGTVTFTFAGIDSVRFSSAEGYLQYADETLTGVAIRWHFGADVLATETEFNYDSDAYINVTGEYQGDLVINGSLSDDLALSISDDEASCTMDISADQVLTDVFFSEIGDGDCPSSGRIDINASVDVECEDEAPAGYENLSVNGDWDITFIFDDGDVTVIYSDGTTEWTTVQTCDSEEYYSPQVIIAE